MLKIPEVTELDAAFGSIKHMPRFSTLPGEFQKAKHVACEFVQHWFFRGIENWTPKTREGVDAKKARRAIAAVLRSFEPKQEHKIACAGYMLDQWFEVTEADVESLKAQAA